MTTTPNDLITIPEARAAAKAAGLDVSLPTLYRWVDEKKLRRFASRVGRNRIRVSRQELLDLLTPVPAVPSAQR